MDLGGYYERTLRVVLVQQRLALSRLPKSSPILKYQVVSPGGVVGARTEGPDPSTSLT